MKTKSHVVFFILFLSVSGVSVGQEKEKNQTWDGSQTVPVHQIPLKDEFDLLGSFHTNDMGTYRKQAETLEKQIVSVIEGHGAQLDAYASVEDFLNKNA